MNTDAGLSSRGLGLVGMARRAGGAVVGVTAARRSVRDGSALLVVTATDAAEGQLDKVRRAASANGVAIRTAPDRERLGIAVGRGPTTVVAITHAGLAREIKVASSPPSAALGTATPPSAPTVQLPRSRGGER